MISAILTHCEIQNFRNIAHERFDFSRGLNVFVGENAQGKTNVLEAIHLIATLQSIVALRREDLVQWEHDESRVMGMLERGRSASFIELTITPRSLRLFIDGKRGQNRQDPIIGIANAVLFTPDELHLVRGAPASRRTFFDRCISRSYARFPSILRDYAELVKNRNRLLEVGSASTLEMDAWNERLVEMGSHIVTARKRFIDFARPIVSGNFSKLMGINLDIDIQYKSDSYAIFDSTVEIRDQFYEALMRRKKEEQIRKVTLVGPHRDDFEIQHSGRPFAAFASQGQTRLMTLALKLLELHVNMETAQVRPIFLLDDVSSELDSIRHSYLMEQLLISECQVFLTTTSLRTVLTDHFQHPKTFQMYSGKARELDLVGSSNTNPKVG